MISLIRLARYTSEWIISECAVIWEEFSKAIFISAFHNAYCDTSCARNVIGSSWIFLAKLSRVAMAFFCGA